MHRDDNFVDIFFRSLSAIKVYNGKYGSSIPFITIVSITVSIKQPILCVFCSNTSDFYYWFSSLFFIAIHHSIWSPKALLSSKRRKKRAYELLSSTEINANLSLHGVHTMERIVVYG